MGLDWIKVRTNLGDDPRVVDMALALGVDADCIVGKLLRVWAWAGEHTTDGILRDAREAHVDHVANLAGFFQKMSEVGWVSAHEGGGIRFPRWNKHNSKSAKKRALDARRAAKYRDKCVTPPSRRPVTKSAPTAEQEQSRASKEQASAKDIAKAGAPLNGDACSLLAAAGLDDKAIRYITTKQGVDQCAIEWAVGRLHDELKLVRLGKRDAIDNPAGYVRNLIDRGKCPRSWRDKWQRRRITEHAAQLNGKEAGHG